MVVHKIEKNISSKEHCIKKQHLPKKLKPTSVKKKRNGPGRRYTQKTNRKSNYSIKKLITKSKKNMKINGVGGTTGTYRSIHNRENDGKIVVIDPSGINQTRTYNKNDSLDRIREYRELARFNNLSDWDNSKSTIPKNNTQFRDKKVLRSLQDSSSKPINIPILK